jgi:hypothetical protein
MTSNVPRILQVLTHLILTLRKNRHSQKMELTTKKKHLCQKLFKFEATKLFVGFFLKTKTKKNCVLGNHTPDFGQRTLSMLSLGGVYCSCRIEKVLIRPKVSIKFCSKTLNESIEANFKYFLMGEKTGESWDILFFES